MPDADGHFKISICSLLLYLLLTDRKGLIQGHIAFFSVVHVGTYWLVSSRYNSYSYSYSYNYSYSLTVVTVTFTATDPLC